jgi:hypothetical protein
MNKMLLNAKEMVGLRHFGSPKQKQTHLTPNPKGSQITYFKVIDYKLHLDLCSTYSSYLSTFSSTPTTLYVDFIWPTLFIIYPHVDWSCNYWTRTIEGGMSHLLSQDQSYMPLYLTRHTNFNATFESNVYLVL